MSVKHLDHVNMTVKDFDETVAWYGRVFDFKLVEAGVMDGHRWGVIRSGDAMLCIYERPGYTYKDRFEFEGEKIHVMRHVGLRYSNRSEWEERMAREGIEVDPGCVAENPHSKSWYIRDPTGHEIEVACWEDDVISFEGCAMS